MNPHFVRCQMFKSTFDSWKTMFREAAEFATGVGRENLITISHSADNSQGVVTVWYWGREPQD